VPGKGLPTKPKCDLHRRDRLVTPALQLFTGLEIVRVRGLPEGQLGYFGLEDTDGEGHALCARSRTSGAARA